MDIEHMERESTEVQITQKRNKMGKPLPKKMKRSPDERHRKSTRKFN